MKTFESILFAAAICAPATALAQKDYPGFCGNYVQISSNAGDCPTCTLLIADNPEIQMYFVESNNGWSAELEWIDGDPSVASGSGQWGEVGGAYSGQPFDLDLSSQDLRLDFAMSHHSADLGGSIQASFRCTDFD